MASVAWAGVSNAASITNHTSFGGSLFDLASSFADGYSKAVDDAKAIANAVNELTSVLCEISGAKDVTPLNAALAEQENAKFEPVLEECQDAFKQ